MPRDLKFRVWYKYQKKMINVLSLDFINKKVFIEATKERKPFGYIHFDDCELLQYTGLKDKNGKDVYEGDILEIKKECLDEETGFENSNAGKRMIEKNIDSVVIVLKSCECLCVEYDIYFMKNGSFMTKNDWFGIEDNMHTSPVYSQFARDLTFLRYIEKKQNCTVIGNIYENPELMQT